MTFALNRKPSAAQIKPHLGFCFAFFLLFAFVANAQPRSSALQQARESHETMVKISDCAIRKVPKEAHDLVIAADPKKFDRHLDKALGECVAGHWSATWVGAQIPVWQGDLARAFLRHPERVSGDFAVAPLPEPPVTDNDIILALGVCVVAGDPVGARAFADAIANTPGERQAYVPIAELARQCIQPWPNISVDATLLRVGLSRALYRRQLADRRTGAPNAANPNSPSPEAAKPQR